MSERIGKRRNSGRLSKPTRHVDEILKRIGNNPPSKRKTVNSAALKNTNHFKAAAVISAYSSPYNNIMETLQELHPILTDLGDEVLALGTLVRWASGNCPIRLIRINLQLISPLVATETLYNALLPENRDVTTSRTQAVKSLVNQESVQLANLTSSPSSERQRSPSPSSAQPISSSISLATSSGPPIVKAAPIQELFQNLRSIINEGNTTINRNGNSKYKPHMSIEIAAEINKLVDALESRFQMQ
ncbi:hypothetical protein AVEN_182253-1 [Araneus ventricosus]|uniref:Uncharacterized protein n=1 Tax=Araneus ventricosus TaxID=182803 RepID=A0A4Y2HAL2_ARAVE|nr:hypothetical protein AVEN_182253-1 [Araneus ventricosus]